MRQRPGLCAYYLAVRVSHEKNGTKSKKEKKKTYLAFAIGPEIDAEADKVVDGRVRGLVHEDGGEDGEGQEDEAKLKGAVQAGAGDGGEGPLEGEHAEAEEEVDDLQDGDGLDGAVEVLGGKVEEDLGPEEAGDGGGDLVLGGVSMVFSIEQCS